MNTVHIVDDDPAMRDSLRVLLESMNFPVRTYRSGKAFLEVAADLSGCLITDVRMPGIDGLELQRRLRESGRPLPVIVMTGQGDIAMAVAAMKAGAVDFLEKPLSDEALCDAVRRALEESTRIQNDDAALCDAAAKIATLTQREREVLQILAEGLTNKEIAAKLGTSPRTVEIQRARVMEKLAVPNLAQLVRLVLAAEPPGP